MLRFDRTVDLSQLPDTDNQPGFRRELQQQLDGMEPGAVLVHHGLFSTVVMPAAQEPLHGGRQMGVAGLEAVVQLGKKELVLFDLDPLTSQQRSSQPLRPSCKTLRALAMEYPAVNLDAEKWTLLEKVHDYCFLLRLLGFVLVVDLVLAMATGSNFWIFRWADVSGRPGLLLTVVLAYGVVMTLGSAIVSSAAMDVLGLVVPTLQSWLDLSPHQPEPDPRHYVSRFEAQAWLAQQTDAARRAPVEKQMADWHQERNRWFSMVRVGWADSALVIASFWVPGSCIASLSQWQWWAPLAVLLVPALPCAYHAWVGMPGHSYVELPELAEALYRKNKKYLREQALADRG